MVAEEDGEAHVVTRLDRPRARIIPERFGRGALTRKELDEAEATIDQITSELEEAFKG